MCDQMFVECFESLLSNGMQVQASGSSTIVMCRDHAHIVDTDVVQIHQLLFFHFGDIYSEE